MENELKQKQIEEIAKIVGYSCCDTKPLHNCTTDCNICIAESIYNAGYCKPSQDVVVLTREEWEQRAYVNAMENELCKKCRAYIAEQFEKVRKETAEKFERLANERIAKEQGKRYGYEASMIDDKSSYDGDIVSLALFEICKEFTGETK